MSPSLCFSSIPHHQWGARFPTATHLAHLQDRAHGSFWSSPWSTCSVSTRPGTPFVACSITLHGPGCVWAACHQKYWAHACKCPLNVTIHLMLFFEKVTAEQDIEVTRTRLTKKRLDPQLNSSEPRIRLGPEVNWTQSRGTGEARGIYFKFATVSHEMKTMDFSWTTRYDWESWWTERLLC